MLKTEGHTLNTSSQLKPTSLQPVSWLLPQPRERSPSKERACRPGMRFPAPRLQLQEQLAIFFLNTSSLYKVWHFRKPKGLILTRLYPKYSIWLNIREPSLVFNDPWSKTNSPEKLEPLPSYLKSFCLFWIFSSKLTMPQNRSALMYSHHLGPERQIKTRRTFNSLKGLLVKGICFRIQTAEKGCAFWNTILNMFWEMRTILFETPSYTQKQLLFQFSAQRGVCCSKTAK